MSRRVEDLVPELRTKVSLFLADAVHYLPSGWDILITQTYRSAAEQAALYAMGRTAAGKIVTYAPPGYSWHEFGRAFDIGFLNERKRLVYAAPSSHPDLWDVMGMVGETLDLEWGGRWKHPDRPHFQYTGGMTLAQARAQGYAPPTT